MSSLGASPRFAARGAARYRCGSLGRNEVPPWRHEPVVSACHRAAACV